MEDVADRLRGVLALVAERCWQEPDLEAFLAWRGASLEYWVQMVFATVAEPPVQCRINGLSGPQARLADARLCRCEDARIPCCGPLHYVFRGRSGNGLSTLSNPPMIEDVL
jgi:hypothetical protein